MPGRLTDMAIRDSTRMAAGRRPVYGSKAGKLNPGPNRPTRIQAGPGSQVSLIESWKEILTKSAHGNVRNNRSRLTSCSAIMMPARGGGPKAKEKEKNNLQEQPWCSRYIATKVRTHNVQSANRNSKGRRWLPVSCATTFTTRYVGTPINTRSMQTHMNVPFAVGPDQQKLSFNPQGHKAPTKADHDDAGELTPLTDHGSFQEQHHQAQRALFWRCRNMCSMCI